ncbi:MAG TPA: hypothetical protein VLK34_02150 [Nocardioidaceae bacterium]|nr:hypothetical protein [Nocardioidaceae bacterium]
MSFSRWLRSNSEHYLMIAAQQRVAREHDARAPRGPRGLRDFFWLRVFAPTYRLVPWPLRHKIMLAMPGSHRQQWAPPPSRGSAARSLFPSTATQQEKESGNGTDRG